MVAVSVDARVEYVPGAGKAWQLVARADANFDAPLLSEEIAYANAHECDWPRSMYLGSGEYVGTAYVEEKPPYHEVIGGGFSARRLGRDHFARRTHRLRMGRYARPGMTFSCAKSYIALAAS